jgi:alkylation response protein AidB-like acyl-CoA dehydrogenase
LAGGNGIGLPPVLNFGSPALVARIAPDVLHGRKRMALAISEPYVGSDVKHIRTVAEKSADGRHYIVTVALSAAVHFPFFLLALHRFKCIRQWGSIFLMF